MNASFDFTKSLSFIETKGKELFNSDFRVFAEDYEIIFQLLVYFLHDVENAKSITSLSGKESSFPDPWAVVKPH
ncbi:MAG TPA: hypothetical protein VIH57_10595 [Bacteroidales bacterium]